MYRIKAARSRVKQQLKRITNFDLERIRTAINALSNEPRPMGAIQLEKDIYRIRIGNYRVIYKIYEDEKLILIGRVVRRSEGTYKRISDLFN